ncbi:hypothetical protein CDO73_21745 [Saccharibacillus sp. O23]|uniref:hypothetical protein n=1 Tax=Saccharibacillus sp. O23 TaxID=2009338 RepID=UPI000B4E38C4|nr:hypothetical protein [Saccharibacillus sp. O23]OWR27562.1 hypothetical protein CDO73_21745 [Saccharibacillus sp. O23]
MRRFREEKGSALVMVMFMMLILTLLGVAVLSAAVGGARRTLTRENDIQSLQLTQKTLDESVAYIASKLDGKTLKADMLGSTLQDVLSQIPALQASNATNGSGVKTELALASTRLLSATASDDFAGSGLKGNSSYTVTLIAQSDINGVKRILKQDVKVSLYPDFLNYAFGSEKDLILNGSPTIKGNIYAGNTLRVSNVANYAYRGQNLQKPSLFPRMVERADKTQPLAFVQSLDAFTLSENGYAPRPVNRGADGSALSGDLTIANVRKALNIDLSQVRIRKNEQFVQVNVDQSFRDKFGQALGISDSVDIPDYSAYLNNVPNALKMPIKPKEPVKPVDPLSSDKTIQDQYKKDLDAYEKLYTNYIQVELPNYQKALNDLKTALTTMTGTVVFNGDLNVDGDWLKGLIQTQRSASSWLIVNGNLTINNTLDNTPLNLYSSVLVTGAVNLGGKINVDSTLLTLGNTKIQDATITGANGDKEIVLISKGPILLNRVDAFTQANVAQTLRGFFYTDATAELYGVGSNFDLQGGFFAKGNLTVNAVVGNSVEDASRQNIIFDDQTVSKTSRFKVDYNDQVFEHQGLALPRVDQISVKADKIELLQESQIPGK